MKRLFFSLGFSLLIGKGFAQERRFTLQQCIDSALQNNINIRRSELATQSAQVNYSQAKSNLLPDLNGLVNHGINKGRSIDPFTNTYVTQSINYANYSLGTNLTLFNGFSLRNTIRQYALANDASKMEWQQAKDELALNVIVAYLQVLNGEDLLAVSKQQVTVSQKQVERLDAMNKQGAINPPQLHELKGQLKESELSVVTNENALESAKLTLTQLMNVPYSTDIKLERTDVNNSLSAPEGNAAVVYERALEKLAAIKAVELRKKSAEVAVKATKGALFPSLSFNGNVNTTYSSIATQDVLVTTTDVPTTNYVVVNGNNLPVFAKKSQFNTEKIRYGSQLENNIFSNIGLSLRLPLFNSFRVRNRIRLAQIEYKNTVLIEEGVQVQLRQQIEQAHLAWTNAWRRYQLLTEQVDEFREAFRAAEVRFNAGVGTSVDYVLAKNNFDRANLNLVIAKYDYLFRKEVLNFYTGERP